MPEFTEVHTAEQYATAAALFREYASWLNIDLCFQNFDAELENLQSMYAPPFGGIILVHQHNGYCGCVAVRRIDRDTAELKRMYIKPAARNLGTGQELLLRALRMAEQSGYKKIRLDTLSSMTAAMKLYRKNGFREIAPYYYNPEKTAVYFEKTLNEQLAKHD